MKFKPYIFALFVSLFVATLILVGFSFWKEKSINTTKGSETIEFVTRLEKEGAVNFKFKTISGVEKQLSEFNGKVVILNFWASWCGPCIEEIPSLISLVKELKGDLVLIAVSGDENLEDLNSFLKSFPEIKSENIYVVWENQKEILKMYNVERLPESYIFNSNMKLAKKIIGSIDWHTADSIEYLKQLKK
jgi:cytochrome c biogenesis protein CcmG, thiol:disulfide interchange protein DsbE